MSTDKPWQKRSAPPFAITEQDWQPSTQAAAFSQALQGRALHTHKSGTDKVVEFVKFGRGHEHGIQNGLGPAESNAIEREVRHNLSRAYASGSGCCARGGLSSVPSHSNTQPEGRGIQGLPGRNNNHNPGDVFPQASRGITGGGMPKWSFERMPSLLQAPLMRDTVKRGVAGCVPSTLVAPPEAPSHLDPNLARRVGRSGLPPDYQKGPETPGSMGTSRSGSTTGRSLIMKRNFSSPEMRGGPPQIGGLHGMIGMSWDNANTSAGGQYRGSSGGFLGF